MNADEIMMELSRKHKRPPTAAIEAAIEQRAEVAPLMLAELRGLIDRFSAILEEADTEQKFISLGKKAVKTPSPLFYGFLLAAEWKQKEAYPLFAELLSWPWAEAPTLLSEMVHDDIAARVMAEIYDGDPSPLFRLLVNRDASQSVRFWQWRTLMALALRGEIGLEVVRSFLTRAFDALEQEPDSHVWQGWEIAVIHLGLADLVPLVERAHDAERIEGRNLDDFHEDWAYARAHPDCPLQDDPILGYRGLASEVEWAVAHR
jgi:hypothetical protein